MISTQLHLPKGKQLPNLCQGGTNWARTRRLQPCGALRGAGGTLATSPWWGSSHGLVPLAPSPGPLLVPKVLEVTGWLQLTGRCGRTVPDGLSTQT